MNYRLFICGYLLSFLLISCDQESVADAIYYNGDIITMSARGDVHQSLGIKDGEILFVGGQEDQKRFQGTATDMIDLEGKTMLPGFIDAHSHFSLAMQTLDWANLSSPPVSDIKSIEDIIVQLAEHRQERNLKSDEWLVGWGYDPDLLSDQRHPNKLDLDDAFPDQPVFLAHASGHLGVVNLSLIHI